MICNLTTQNAEVTFQSTFKWEHKFFSLDRLPETLIFFKKTTNAIQFCQNIFNLESETKNSLGTLCTYLILKY